MTRPCVAIALACLTSTAAAQSAMQQPLLADCLKIVDAEKRLTCYDTVHSFVMPDVLAEEQPKQLGNKVIIRDTASIVDFGAYDLGAKGGSLSLQRSDGENASLSKIAMIVAARPINNYLNREHRVESFLGTLQPFLGTSWVRDTTKKEKQVDLRDLSIGLIGPLWDSPRTVLATLQLSRRFDTYGTSDGLLGRAHFDYIDTNWASGLGYGGISFVPHVGVLYHRRNGGGADEGVWQSSYVGISASRNFVAMQRKLTASLLVRQLYDLKAPTSNSERRDHYANLSLDYFWSDPEDKNVTFAPSLFISREVGTDFLTGTDATNKTIAGIRFRLN